MVANSRQKNEIRFYWLRAKITWRKIFQFVFHRDLSQQREFRKKKTECFVLTNFSLLFHFCEEWIEFVCIHRALHCCTDFNDLIYRLWCERIKKNYFWKAKKGYFRSNTMWFGAHFSQPACLLGGCTVFAVISQRKNGINVAQKRNSSHEFSVAGNNRKPKEKQFISDFSFCELVSKYLQGKTLQRIDFLFCFVWTWTLNVEKVQFFSLLLLIKKKSLIWQLLRGYFEQGKSLWHTIRYKQC